MRVLFVQILKVHVIQMIKPSIILSLTKNDKTAKTHFPAKTTKIIFPQKKKKNHILLAKTKKSCFPAKTKKICFPTKTKNLVSCQN